MYTEERMKKEERSLPGTSTREQTRDGRLFMLTRLLRLQLRDLTKTSDSMSIDHSTSCQDFQ